MSKFNEEPIDIVIPWVNPNDPIWQKQFKVWKEKETGEKASNRFRDLDSLKYVFRSIEKYARWVRYIFLVLSGPTQIPNWLRTNHPKLRIVYHNDYIPENLLPTFNSNTIIMHLSKIEELSNNFILFNDDTFLMKNIGENFFFENDKPKGCLQVQYNGYRPDKNNYFLKELNNNSRLIAENIGKVVFLKHFHMPLAYSKTFWEFCWHKNNNKLKNSFSKFRTAYNYTDWFFNDLGLLTNQVTNVKDMYIDCCFICCTNNPNFKKFDNVLIACFNDDMDDKNYNRVKKEFHLYFTKKFSKKSTFEKF